MSLRHAILVLLEEEEASGYDLAREFAHGMGNVWNATHQQIYLELGRLHKEQMVDFRQMPQSGRPDKKLYHITDKGRSELRRWMRKPAPPSKLRDVFMIKIAGGHLADPLQLLAELRKQMREHEEKLETFRRMEAGYRKLSSEEQERRVFAWMALRRGLIGEESWLQWALEVETMLENMAEGKSRVPAEIPEKAHA